MSLALALQFAAPALRAHAPSGTDQLGSLALLTAEQLDAAGAASATALQELLRKVQQQLLEINQAHDALKEQLKKEPGKYQIRKMEVGDINHFHKGLTDRIGTLPPAAAPAF